MISKGLIASITASFTIAGAVFLGSFTENIFNETNNRIAAAFNGHKVSNEHIIGDGDHHLLSASTDQMELTLNP